MSGKAKNNQLIKQKDKPETEHIDLTAKLYPAYILVDENDNPVENLRGAYETGDNDGEAGISAIDFEGYRNFRSKRVMQSWVEINNYDIPEAFKSSYKKQPICPPVVQEPSKRPQERIGDVGGHFTLYGHEWVPHTGINSLLTQNPVIVSSSNPLFGYTEDGCGETKIKRLSPAYHPISFKLSYECWDEKQYLKVFDTSEKSPDTYNLFDAIYFNCPETRQQASSHIICINHHNNQVYVWCPNCFHRLTKYPWHQIHDHNILECISDDLGIDLIKYKKAQIEEEIQELVREMPGINKYQIVQVLNIPKGKVNRGITSLKKKHLVRTRRVGKAICFYPISEKMGTDLQ